MSDTNLRQRRWTVFVCSQEDFPMKVGYEPEEYADYFCSACGAPLVPVDVVEVVEA